MLFQYTALMIERELINQHGREQGLKLPFEQLRGKAPWKGKRLFQGKKKQNEEAAADMAPTGAHSKKKKRRKLKKKVVIPVAVVLLAGGWGVHHILTAGGADGTQTYTESEAVRQDNPIDALRYD